MCALLTGAQPFEVAPPLLRAFSQKNRWRGPVKCPVLSNTAGVAWCGGLAVPVGLVTDQHNCRASCRHEVFARPHDGDLPTALAVAHGAECAGEGMRGQPDEPGAGPVLLLRSATAAGMVAQDAVIPRRPDLQEWPLQPEPRNNDVVPWSRVCGQGSGET